MAVDPLLAITNFLGAVVNNILIDVPADAAAGIGAVAPVQNAVGAAAAQVLAPAAPGVGALQDMKQARQYQASLSRQDVKSDAKLLMDEFSKRIQTSLALKPPYELLHVGMDRFDAIVEEAKILDPNAAEYTKLVVRAREIRSAVLSMYNQASRWNLICAGRVTIPDFTVPQLGITETANHIRNQLLSAEIIPTEERYPNYMIHGPPGAGKTYLAHAVAYSLNKALHEEAYNILDSLPEESFTASLGASATKAKALEQVKKSSFLSFYFIDVLKMRLKDTPRHFLSKLKQTMECLQIDRRINSSAAFLSAPGAGVNAQLNPQALLAQLSNLQPLALVVLDNFDTLFLSDKELDTESRKTRPNAQFDSFVYHPLQAEAMTTNGSAGAAAAAAVEVKAGGTTTRRAGDGGKKSTEDTMSWTSKEFQTELLQLLDPMTLQSDYSQLRLVWNVRQPWKLPRELLSLVPKKRQQFVDLPARGFREAIASQWLQRETLKNYFSWLMRVGRLTANERKGLLDKELKAAQDAKDESRINDVKMVQALAITASLRPGTTEALHKSIMASPTLKQQWDIIQTSNRPFLMTLADMTGMNITGYCYLKSKIPKQNLDLFLRIYRKDEDYTNGDKLLTNHAVFGFTIEDEIRLLAAAQGLKSKELLTTGLAEIKAYMDGFEPSAGCNDFFTGALDFARTADCQYKLDSQLNVLLPKPDQKDKAIPVFPLSLQFGSHRITTELIKKALKKFPLTRQDEYYEYAAFAITGKHEMYTSNQEAKRRKCMEDNKHRDRKEDVYRYPAGSSSGATPLRRLANQAAASLEPSFTSTRTYRSSRSSRKKGGEAESGESRKSKSSNKHSK